jgi:hypothetical protein
VRLKAELSETETRWKIDPRVVDDGVTIGGCRRSVDPKTTIRKVEAKPKEW